MSLRMLFGAGLFLALVCGGTAADARSEPEPAPQSNLYRVGATGIHCYREPCPRKGIVPVENRSRLHPLWSGTTPPALRGADHDRRRIVEAWEKDECVIVRGLLLPDAVLEVEQVIGPC